MPKNKKILLLEDDEAIREMYRIKFEHAGIEVTVAEDGKQALIYAVRMRPDLLLLDLKTPTIKGEEVLQKIQKLPWSKSMKVIVLTNISYNEAPKLLQKLHFDRYVVKAHHTPAQVLRIVKEVLD